MSGISTYYQNMERDPKLTAMTQGHTFPTEWNELFFESQMYFIVYDSVLNTILIYCINFGAYTLVMADDFNILTIKAHD